MPATYEPIATRTLTSQTGTVTFTSIPSTYTDIVLVATGTALGNTGYGLRFNNDTGSNYNATYVEGNGISTLASERYPSNFCRVAWNSLWDGDGWVSHNQIHIQSYSNTSVWTPLLWHSNSDTYVEVGTGTWRSSAVIDRIDIITTSNDFAIGSTFTLYGIARA